MFSRRKPSIVYWLGKKLYLNITNKCSNDCYFCLRKFRNGVEGFNLKLSEEPTVNKVITELQKVINLKNWSEIVFCGFGEPLERMDCVIEVTRWIKKYYGKIVRIRIDTNGHGFLLNNSREVIKELKEAGVEKISVSLNAHNKEVYNQVCKPIFENAFESILIFIEKAKEIMDVEITAVAIPEINVSKIKEIAKKMEVNLRIREYIPGFW